MIPTARSRGVEFYNHSTKLGEDLTAPTPSFGRTSPPARISSPARAQDDRLGTAQSVAVEIEVTSQPPTVTWIQPAPNALVGLGLQTSLIADAVDLDGTVMQVEFFAGSQSLGVATQIPFETPWIPTAPGDYALTAVATDDSGASSTSTVNTVTAVPRSNSPTRC